MSKTGSDLALFCTGEVLDEICGHDRDLTKPLFSRTIVNILYGPDRDFAQKQQHKHINGITHSICKYSNSGPGTHSQHSTIVAFEV